MLATYLFCLVFGGGFLLVSLLGAGDSGDVDMEVDLDADLDIDADHDTAASKIFSLRTLFYAIFGFGATGSALTALGFGPALTLGLSTVGGIASGAIVGALFNYLGRSSSGEVSKDLDLIGLTGLVTLPLTPEIPGTIMVERAGRRFSLRALPHGSTRGDPSEWRAVLVVEVDQGIVRVAPLDEEGPDLLNPGGEEP